MMDVRALSTFLINVISDSDFYFVDDMLNIMVRAKTELTCL